MALKILLLGFNRSYSNPTAETIQRCFANVGRLIYFGPGYSSSAELEWGLEKYLDKNQDIDFLVTDSYVFESDKIIKRKNPFSADFIRFLPSQYAQFALQYRDVFYKYSKPKILIANWDTYGISHEMVDRVIQSNCYIMDPGFSLQKPLEEILSIFGPGAYGTDNWYNLSMEYKHKFIAVPHTLLSSEFDHRNLNSRPDLFNVIGTGYPERKKAKELLPFLKKLDDLKARFISKYHFHFRSTMSYMDVTLHQSSYMNKISESKFCYCSGGPWMYPVRKYFEIPARGSVSIGWPCLGAEHIGIIDGLNFIKATSNEDIVRILDSYNEEKHQSIASAGRQLMWTKHSEFARTSQIRESLHKILTNQFKGSYWHDGEYKHF
ncbi:MAG TPA: glycosyltransferase [Saprospiraceae bacterium]|nr:glycosyltransferase [Saprospiraceae bacterium]